MKQENMQHLTSLEARRYTRIKVRICAHSTWVLVLVLIPASTLGVERTLSVLYMVHFGFE